MSTPIQPPLDEKGRPMVMVRANLNDLIGLPKFSNITMQAEIVRWVPDEGDSAIDAAFANAFDRCERIVGERRAAVVALREQMEGNVPSSDD